MLDSVQAILPVTLKHIVQSLPKDVKEGLEEIRIRKHRPLEMLTRQGHVFVNAQSHIVQHVTQAYMPSAEDCKCILELLTHHSLYSYEAQIKQGYITVAGGHRIGLAGRTLVESGQVTMIRDVGSFNIRIARDVKGVSLEVIPYLLDRTTSQLRIYHTLVLSLPGRGKTTLLRDIARQLSSGSKCSSSFKVGVVDERSEIAACVKGSPSFELGSRIDVMDACPKAEGMMMMIRSMSPDVLIVDEIGKPADVRAIQEARYAGISVIASAHAHDLQDASRSPILKELFELGVFERYIVIQRSVHNKIQYGVLHASGNMLGCHDEVLRKV
jgi:stage III sporulation protein AA